MVKSILVIGATGLLGEPVARRLDQDGYNVRLMIREQKLEMAETQFGDHFEIVTGDISDLESLGRALSVSPHCCGGLCQDGCGFIWA